MDTTRGTMQFLIKAPVFVARQLVKHQVGLVWNEVSRRYVDDKPERYIPFMWRKRAENKKQGQVMKKLSLILQCLFKIQKTYIIKC